MIEVVSIDKMDVQQWQALQQQSGVASWWQSDQAYAVLRVCPGWRPWGRAVVRDGQLRGVMMGFVTGSRYRLLRRWTCRTIINAGPLLAEDITDDELEALLRGVTAGTRSVYVETRNFADYSRWHSVFEVCGWQYQPHYDVTMDCSSCWWERIREPKQRKIRQSLEAGVTYREAQTQEEFCSWYALLERLYRHKVHRPLLSRETLMQAWRSGVTLLLVEAPSDSPKPTSGSSKPTSGSSLKGREIVGGVMIPHNEHQAYEWYICGPTMVTYAMMDWCSQHAIAHLDLMGAGEPGVPYGVRDFKLQMGGDLHEWGRWVYVAKPWIYRLGKWVIKRSH